MKNIKLISLIIIISMLASMFIYMPTVSALNLDNDNAPLLVDQNSAYAIFGSTTQTSGVTVTGTTTPVTYEGVTGAQLAADQTLTVALDGSKTSSKYVVVVKFYDPGVNEEDFIVAGRKMRKTGMEPGWKSVSFLVDDAAFKGSMNYGCDIRIRSGAFNAISKIEVMDYSSFTHAGTVGTYTPSVVDDSKSGNFFHIYCDGELIGRTRTSSYKIWKAPKGEHQYIIDVVEPYGKTVYRQRGIVVPD